MSDGEAPPMSRSLRLRVYVAGSAPNSVVALDRLRALLARHPSIEAQLEIVDVLEQPEIALRDQILLTPTTVKLEPLPECRIIGSLSDSDGLASVLGLAALSTG
jgi:circadian clock protein KaiB